MYDSICSYKNLELAFSKAKQGKTLKPYVIIFENELEKNLIQLREELSNHIYKPKRLQTFIIKDPKTRKISKSDFRDRVVHHAICNIIEPIFDKDFIYDSYANRLGKGTLNAIKRFDYFKHKVSKNNTKTCYVLKADVKHYFETVDHKILLSILKRKITDIEVIRLIKIILKNYKSKVKRKGMPLGNLTSQFFANVYLNELDTFVKQELRAKHYIRYVDDFVILDSSKKQLKEYKENINKFLQEKLALRIHPDKSKILKLHKGIDFLGFRIFFHHKLVRKKNLRKFDRKFAELKTMHEEGLIDREKAIEKFEGWLAYVSHGNSYTYRTKLIRNFSENFPIQPEIKITKIHHHERFSKKIKSSEFPFSVQKTLQLLRKGLSAKEIAEKRDIKESTVWNHFSNLIEHHQCSLYEVLDKERAKKILSKIRSENDKLKDISNRLNDSLIAFDEISCALASVKCKNKKKNIIYLTKWYQKTFCYRKCYNNKTQRNKCKLKFDYFVSKNINLEMKRKDFLNLFNNHIKICVLSEKEKIKFISWKEFKASISKT